MKICQLANLTFIFLFFSERIEIYEFCLCCCTFWFRFSELSNVRRLKGNDMLELLRGKRLVFVGDSLNRNMWESLVCTLGNSLKDKSKMFEASGREEFRTEGSYSIIFTVCHRLFPHYV